MLFWQFLRSPYDMRRPAVVCLLQIGYVFLLELFPKDWFVGPQSDYNDSARRVRSGPKSHLRFKTRAHG